MNTGRTIRPVTRAAKGLATLAAAGAITLVTAVPAQAAGTAAEGPHELVKVERGVEARSAPTSDSRRIDVVRAIRPIANKPTMLPVLSRATDGLGSDWLRVLLPGRPNSHSGWIPGLATSPATTTSSINIDISRRRVEIFRSGRLARSFKAIVGHRSTPTPSGDFFVEEIVNLGGGAAGAPYALALSARSNVLRRFNGGPGQIAIHGTNNIGGTLGTAASHGCIRVRTRAIRWLAGHVDAGSRVTISR